MSETNNSEKSKGYLESIVNGTNWVALGVVAFAVIGLIAIIFNLLSKDEENNAPKQILVRYEISVDKVSLKNAKDSTTLTIIERLDENNKKILNEINSSVDAQYKRMESILSVQEDRSRLFSYGAGFLAILVAIATFFGFKSINEMKKSTIEAAEYEAKKVAEEEAKKVATATAKEVAELEAKTTSTKISKEEISKQMSTIKEDLENALKSLLLNENKREVETVMNAKVEEIEKLKTAANDLIAELQVVLEQNKRTIHEDQLQSHKNNLNNETSEPVTEEHEHNNESNDKIDFQ